MAAAVTFLAYAAPTNRPLAAKDAFAALTLFNTLRFPLMGLGEATSSTVQLLVSVDRLQELLTIPEVVPSNPAEEASEGRDGDADGDGSYRPPRVGAAAAEAGADEPREGEGSALSIVDGAFWWPVPPPEDKGGKKQKSKKKKEQSGAKSGGDRLRGREKIPPVAIAEVGEHAQQSAVVVDGGVDASAAATAKSNGNGVSACLAQPAASGAAPANNAGAGPGPAKRGFVLSGLNLSVSAGEILAVIGPVGAGKSTLISGILADTCRSGRLFIHAPCTAPSTSPVIISPSAMDLELVGEEQSAGGGSPDFPSYPRASLPLSYCDAEEAWCGGVAYCGQNAWLLSGTLRDNILFGEKLCACRRTSICPPR